MSISSVIVSKETKKEERSFPKLMKFEGLEGMFVVLVSELSTSSTAKGIVVYSKNPQWNIGEYIDFILPGFTDFEGSLELRNEK